jgi:hypothetical protein
MAAPTGGAGERQSLLQSPTAIYDAFSETSAPVDPQVLAKTVELVAAQMVVIQTRSPPPVISSATIQQELSYDGGTYVGDVIDEMPHGRGTLTYPTGHQRKKVEGEWIEGDLHGKGLILYNNGDRFEGDWQYGLLHGMGILNWANGNKYEGQCLAGKRHGQGTMHWAGGSSYFGEWVGDKIHGKGTLRNSNGNTYEGQWDKGQRSGQGKETFANGTWYEGQWINDKPSGEGFEKAAYCDKKGIFRDGKLWHGKLEGEYIFECKDGVYTTPCCAYCTIS